MQVAVNPDWPVFVLAGTDMLFATRLGPEITASAKAYCPVFGGANSTASDVSLAAAEYTSDDEEPGSLRDSIKFYLLGHFLIVEATGSSERQYAAYVELGHRIVAWGYDTGEHKEAQPFLRPALYQLRVAA